MFERFYKKKNFNPERDRGAWGPIASKELVSEASGSNIEIKNTLQYDAVSFLHLIKNLLFFGSFYFPVARSFLFQQHLGLTICLSASFELFRTMSELINVICKKDEEYHNDRIANLCRGLFTTSLIFTAGLGLFLAEKMFHQPIFAACAGGISSILSLTAILVGTLVSLVQTLHFRKRLKQEMAKPALERDHNLIQYYRKSVKQKAIQTGVMATVAVMLLALFVLGPNPAVFATGLAVAIVFSIVLILKHGLDRNSNANKLATRGVGKMCSAGRIFSKKSSKNDEMEDELLPNKLGRGGRGLFSARSNIGRKPPFSTESSKRAAWLSSRKSTGLPSTKSRRGAEITEELLPGTCCTVVTL
jgi:hypothetical membrane protein